MSHPIPITFTRQLPDCEGLWLWRRAGSTQLSIRSVAPNFYGCLFDTDSYDYVSRIGGEWAGPLQIVNENEAGDRREGKD